MSKTFLRIISVALFILLIGIPAAFAIGNGELSISPVSASNPDDPRTQSWFIYDFGPGTSHDDKVLIKNESNESKTIKLYAVDGYTTPQGGFALRNANDVRENVGKWLMLEKDNISLAAGESESISFKYTVPQNAEPGEYAGGIIAEDAKSISGQGINVIQRVGVRVYHTVPGDKVEGLTLLNSEMKTGGNLLKSNRWFEANVKNIGNVSMTIVLKESIVKRDGTVVASFESSEQTVLPNSSVAFKTLTWEDPWFGFFEAKGGIYAKNGKMLVEILPQQFIVINWVVLMAITLLVVIIIFLFVRIFHRKNKKKHKK